MTPLNFNYFGDVGRPNDAAYDDDDAERNDLPQRPARRWRFVFKLFFIGFCAWFAWQYHDLAQYSFQADVAPLELGDVTSLTPNLVPHNSYVCVDGISEHRGMTQLVSRVLGQGAQPFWYFRLLGSRGIFVEVPPNAEAYGITQAMHVCGRAVDPGRSPTFHKLILAYENTFATEVFAPTRIVQSGMKPCAYRLRYLIALGGLAAVLGLQIWAMLGAELRKTKRRRHAGRF